MLDVNEKTEAAVNSVEIKNKEEIEKTEENNTEETNNSTEETQNEIPLIDLSLIEPYRVESEKKKTNKKKINIPTFFVSVEMFLMTFMIFMELIFHLFHYGFTGENLIYKIVFGCIFGMLLGICVSLLPKMAEKIVLYVTTGVASVYFIAQLIYYAFFDTFLSLTGTLEVAGQAFDFTDVILKAIISDWWKIVLLLVPMVLLAVVLGRKVVEYSRHNWKQYVIEAISTVLLLIITICVMKVFSNEIYSNYEVYKNYTSVNMAVEKLGVCEALFLDVKEGVRNKLGIQKNDLEFETVDVSFSTEQTETEEVLEAFANIEDSSIEETTEIEIDTSPNILDIDMKSLIDSEQNSNIKAIHEYVNAQIPTNKNEYTGMFEGYNVIYIVAEGFTGYSIDQNRTPMLYQMSHEGFVFNNYYTPLWYGSTLGGEYANLTGLMPKNGTYLSMSRAGSNGNDMYFTLSRQLEREGYSVRGYHNNDYAYYDRNISHPNMGLEWIGMGNGLEYEVENGTALWPQSDVKMINDTFDDYEGDEPFYTYYLTVSGHVMYNFGGNAMAKKHQDITENMKYSDTTKAYLACQYELELALEQLVTKLDAAGVLDNTLIVLTADHVPYDNKDVVDELAGKTLDNTFGWYKNKLIIWSASMDEPVEVDKFCYSLDILPTVSNLLGLDYDSRMLVGQDIMSDSEGLVIFNDRSFMTDHMSYNANNGEIKSFDGSEISEEYVEAMKLIVKNKFSIADAINENDYYKYIHEAVDEKNDN